MILTLRTDKPEAEIGLFDKSGKELAYVKWQAHRELSETIHRQIANLLADQSIEYSDLVGIVYYEGPGSFTGLRIGAAVGNALGRSLKIPIVSAGSDGWIDTGITNLNEGKDLGAIPYYDSEAKTTTQKK